MSQSPEPDVDRDSTLELLALPEHQDPAGDPDGQPAAARPRLPRARRRLMIAGAAALVLLGLGLAWWLWPLYGPPALILQSPAVVEADNRDEIIVDVTVTALPDAVYPAASLSVGFDSTKLEFLGVRQGTMTTRNGTSPQPAIPVWAADPDFANSRGLVTTMYLDSTAGAFAYTGTSHEPGEREVLLRLAFRLRDSVQPGDNLPLTVADAVLATTDNATTGSALATASRTLRAYPAQIVVQR